MKTAFLLTSAAALVAMPAQAETAPAEPSQRGPHVAPEIVISAPFVNELDVIRSTSVLDGTRLLNDLGLQIGETLTRLPGVSATSFAPGASRPVLRGFQGERIRVLTDGIGTFDVANTSADHAVTIDPLTTERIEVLRGPAVLLFGGQAIGGAVNAIDRRIPRDVPENGVHVDVLGAYGTAADERSIAGAADLEVARGLVFHVDGSFRETDDLGIGGFVLSPTLRREQLAIAAEERAEGNLEEAEEAEELAAQRGVLPNSATRTYTAGAGLALIRDRGSFGVSVGYFNTRYGISKRPGLEHDHGGEEHGGEEDHDHEEGHEHGEENVSIDLEQVRLDMRGEVLTTGGFLDRIRVRAGYANYEHTEFEGDEVGTVFKSDGFEGRVELVQRERNGWRGVIGAQGSTRDFQAIGPEAFVPPNQTDQIGIFTVQEVDFGRAQLEVAARYDRVNTSSNAVRLGLDEDAPTAAVERSFNAFSGAASLSYAVASDFRVGVSANRAVRAPSAEELFSNGPHIATQAFEVGNPDFRTEKSWGAELYGRGRVGPLSLAASAYANWFDGFIYEQETGLELDDLPVFQFLQRDATYYGFEVEASAKLFEAGRFNIVADGVADYVRATIDNGGGPVPRIPPLRLLGGIEAQSDHLTGRVEAQWVDSQDRTAQFETPTDSFTLVNASIAWRPWGTERETVILLSANNIFDVDARRHASFTKDFVPLAGRDFRVSARFSF